MSLKIKNFIFYFIITYIILFSIFFISNAFKIKKVSEEKLESEVNIEHVEFLNDSIQTIENNEQYQSGDKCAVAIRNAIKSEKDQKYGEVETYKELFTIFKKNAESYIYAKDVANTRLSMCAYVLKNCNLEADDSGNISTERSIIREKVLPHCTYTTSVLEYEFYYDYLENINLKLDLSSKFIDRLFKPSVSMIRSRNKTDFRSRLITEQKEYVEHLLEIVGGIYE